MLELRFIASGLFALSAIVLCFQCRAVFAANRMPTGKDGATAFGCIALLHAAALLCILVAWFSTEWRSELFTLLPMVILVSYVAQFALMRQLRCEWTESPFFKSAAFAPLLGCIFVLLIWWNEHRRTS